MPIFSQTISAQQTATSAGVANYPRIGAVVQGSTMYDSFNRTTLNPTNMPALYITGGVGTPAVNIGKYQLSVGTSTAANDNAYCILSELGFGRLSPYIDPKSNITFNVVFKASEATSVQHFVGFQFANTSAITALPTTGTVNFGVYLDTSVSNNWKLTSSDTSIQSTTDTTLAVNTTDVLRLQIQWTGNDSATITLFKNSTGTAGNTWITNSWTSVKSQTVSSLITSNTMTFSCFLNFFTQTLTTAARHNIIYEWSAVTQ